MFDPAHFNVDRAFDSLKRDYTLIGKRHIKTWQAWLIVGIFAGAVGAVTLVANRSGEVEKGKAAGDFSVGVPSFAVASRASNGKVYLFDGGEDMLSPGHNIKVLSTLPTNSSRVRVRGLSQLNTNRQKSFSLLPGWPQRPFDPVTTDELANVGSTPLLYDLDNDGRKEVITYSFNQVTIWRSDGSLMPGWPQTTDTGTISMGGNLPPPAIGDIDGDGKPEIVFVEYFVSSDDLTSGHVCGYAWHIDGLPVRGWQNHCWQDNAIGLTYAEVLLYDINQDGTNEVIFRNRILDGDEYRIYVVNGNGSFFSGWPVVVSKGTQQFLHMPTVGDIDGDGKPEIVALLGYQGSPEGEIVIYDQGGKEKRRFKTKTPTSRSDDVILVDIDQDGKKEIGFSTADQSIVFYHDDGSLVSGWPFTHPGNQKNALIATDFSSDKSIEIVFPYHHTVPGLDEYVTVLNRFGKELSGWPQQTAGRGFWVRPQTGDINGDGDPDIVTTTGPASGSADPGLIYAWSISGQLIPGFPLTLSGPSQSGVALGDVDGNGTLELAAGLYDGTVYIWQLGVPPHGENNYWPVWKQNVRNTGLFAPPSPTPTLSQITPSSGSVNTPVTLIGTGFTPTGNTLRFGGGVIPNLASADGRTLLFTIPGSINSACYFSSPRCLIPARPVPPGVYDISITNANGTSGNAQITVVASSLLPIKNFQDIKNLKNIKTAPFSLPTIMNR